MKKIYILCLILVSIVLFSCVHSEEIVVTFPQNADWQFEYFDSLGISIGGGVAIIDYNFDVSSFTMTLTESSFGDKAVINGFIDSSYYESDFIPFTAEGKWFQGQDFVIEGHFKTDSEYTEIYDGTIAYSKDIEKDEKEKISNDFKNYRIALIENNNAEKPIYEKYLDKLYTLKAIQINNPITLD